MDTDMDMYRDMVTDTDMDMIMDIAMDNRSTSQLVLRSFCTYQAALRSLYHLANGATVLSTN
jgi:hypothetical protein